MNLIGSSRVDNPKIQSCSEYLHTVDLDSPDPTSYDVALGLNSLDMERRAAEYKLDATVDVKKSSYFQMGLYNMGGVLHNAGASYFKKTENETDFQFGIFDTEVIRKREKTGPGYIDGFVPFSKPFDQPPKVFVGISGFSIKDCWNLRVYADNISVGGFNVHVETEGDSWSGGALVTWIAFPAHKAGVEIGTFSGDGFRRLPFDGYTSFDTRFSRPPSIFTAITQFHADRNYNLRVNLFTDNVTSDGMQWHIQTWWDTQLYSVTGAYLAFNT